MDGAKTIDSSDYRGVESLIQSVSDEPYVEHYGIKGMKWGVRRSQETLDRLAGRVRSTASSVKDKASKARSERSADNKKIASAKRKSRVETAKARAEGKARVEKARIDRKVKEAESGSDTKTDTKRPVSELTDKELKARVDRLNLEKQYRTLTTPKKSKTTGDVIKDFAVKTTGKLANQAADAMIKKTVNSIFGTDAHEKGKQALEEVTKHTESVTKPTRNAIDKVAPSTSTKTPRTRNQAVSSLISRFSTTGTRHLDSDRVIRGKDRTEELINRSTDRKYVGRRRLNDDRKVTNPPRKRKKR